MPQAMKKQDGQMIVPLGGTAAEHVHDILANVMTCPSWLSRTHVKPDMVLLTYALPTGMVRKYGSTTDVSKLWENPWAAWAVSRL